MLNLWDTKDFEFAIAEELARSYVSSHATFLQQILKS